MKRYRISNVALIGFLLMLGGTTYAGGGPKLLNFSSAAQTLASGVCSAQVIVQTLSANWNPSAVYSDTPVSLSLSGVAGNLYSDSGCTQSVASVVIPNGASQAGFYFIAKASGSLQITASSANLTSATQTETIGSGSSSGGGTTTSPSPTPTPTPTPTSTKTTTSGIWAPGLVTEWQWQLTTPIDLTVNASVYDIDGFDNDASVVAALHSMGRKAICYISVGSYENWRPDASLFPSSVLGSSNGWPGEKWLDIRQISILGPIMQNRFAMCKAKGFDAIEPDNVDGYSNKSGFPLTYQDQINYNTYIANLAHSFGLGVALKNDIEQIPDLLSSFDFALNEQCFQYSECGNLQSFISAGKAVLEVEYKLSTDKFCPQANSMNFNSMQKNLNLDSYRVPCR